MVAQKYKEALVRTVQLSLFEENNPKTREEIVNRFKDLVKDVKVENMIVVCDETNNTEQRLAKENDLKIDVYYKEEGDTNFKMLSALASTKAIKLEELTGEVVHEGSTNN